MLICKGSRGLSEGTLSDMYKVILAGDREMPDIRSFEPLWNEWYIKETLGSGSYGTVYKIEKRELGESYFAALKHIPIPPTDASGKDSSYTEETEDVTGTAQERYRDLLDSLLAEIKINNRLKGYTNIVSYEDHRVITRPDALGYDVLIKMELLTSLPELLRQRVLTVGDVVRLGREISTALMVLQQNKIIHRDIKPANIFVNSGGNFKLGDFGVAKVLELANEGMSMKGTLSYMAPEVARGEVGDYRLDIYSLGLVLYRLLNYNRGPFLPLPPEKVTHTQASEANRRRMRGEVIPPPAMADERLGEIILRACAFSPDERWSSAEELRQQLDQYLNATSLDVLEMIAMKRQAISGANTSATATTGGSVSSVAQREGDQELSAVPPPIDQTTHLNQETEQTMLLGATDWDESVNEKTEVIAPDLGDEHTVLLRGVDALEGTLPQPTPAPKRESQIKVEPAEEPLAEVSKEHSAVVPTKVPANVPTKTAKAREGVFVPSGKKTQFPLIPISIVGGVFLVAAIVGGALLMNWHKDKPDLPPSPSEKLAATDEPSFDPDVVVWKDSTMEVAIRRILEKPQGDIRIDDLSNLQEVRLTEETGFAIKTLDDLEYLPNLKTLDLSGVKLQSADMSALSTLSKLEALNLTDCGVGDIDSLAKLTEIRNLALGGNSLTNLDFVSSMPHLSYLDISGNSIDNLVPLSNCGELQTLIANDVPVEDWSPVAHVPSVARMPEPEPEPEPTPVPTPTPTPKPTATPKPKTTPKPTQRPKNTSTPVATPTPVPVQTQPPTPATIDVTGISISRGSLILEVGGMSTLTATVSPSNATNKSVSWASSNSGVVRVNGGTVTAMGPGTATVTASCGGYSASCAVTVN